MGTAWLCWQTAPCLVTVFSLALLIGSGYADETARYGIQPNDCLNSGHFYMKSACSCHAGFGGDTCATFDCQNGVYNATTNTCQCHDGWIGTLCTVCQTDEVCQKLPGATNRTRCDTSINPYKKKSYDCWDKDRMVEAILGGTRAFVVAEAEHGAVPGNSTFAFSFMRDVKKDGTPLNNLFSCNCYDCAEYSNPDDPAVYLMYNCSAIHCAMACQPGSVDCTPILKGVVDKVSGNAVITCSKNGECNVKEIVLNKLFRGGVHVNCTAGECVNDDEPPPPPPPKPIPTPEPKTAKQVERTKFVLYILIALIVAFVLAALVTWAVVAARNRSHAKQYSMLYDEHSVTSYLRNLGQFHGSLAWTNLCYDIEVKGGWHRPRILKRCLNEVTGVAHPGEVVAIMGPSGSGKTTCLDLLSGREKSGDVSGQVLVSGRPPGPHFKRMSGFVDQEDCLIGTLTVRESLTYSALLRLPDSVPSDVKRKRVETVMERLKIASIANSTIGTAFTRGISGGEKRRVSVAMELVPCPSVLFLDEPTSGLDSSSAFTIVECLAQLAHDDDTVIVMSIHQPRSNIFQLFDKLLLLSKGDMVYFGPASQSLSYMQQLGFAMPGGYNPADYLIDLVVECETHHLAAQCGSQSEDHSMDIGREDAHCLQNCIGQRSTDVQLLEQDKDIDDLVGAYAQSPLAKQYWDEIDNMIGEARSKADATSGSEADMKRAAQNTTASWFMQCVILAHRTLTNLLRNPYLVFGHMMAACVVGVILGLIYFHTGDRYDTKITDFSELDKGGARSNIINKFVNRMASLLLMCAFLAFGSLSSLELFYAERVVYVHERANGFYYPSPYYVQKVLFDIIPLRIFPPMAMGGISYYMIGLREGMPYFVGFIVILVLVNLCASSICMLIGLTTTRPATGNLAASLIILFSLMLTPIFNNVDSMPPFLSWIHYLSFFYYGYEALAVNELDGLTLSGNVYGDIEAADVDSSEILRKLGLYPENYILDVSVLFGASLALLLAGYLVLKYCVRQCR